jgi:hypothetical protein
VTRIDCGAPVDSGRGQRQSLTGVLISSNAYCGPDDPEVRLRSEPFCDEPLLLFHSECTVHEPKAAAS